MTRNFVICMVPTVLAFFAIYWLRRRKKTKHVTTSDLPSNSVLEKEEVNKSSLVSSDLDNTLSDASSFASPISSEKSSETDSPLFDSPLHVASRHNLSDLTLPNCIESTKDSYAGEVAGFLKFEDLTNNGVLKDSFGTKCLDFENNSEARQSSKSYSSPIVIQQNTDFFKNDDLFLSESKKEKQSLLSTNNHTLDFSGSFESENNETEHCFQKKVFECENAFKESEKVIETDCQSSAFDENSLSYVSDESEGKSEFKNNKDSLSSVLDESSLLSSFCDEKSSASNSPIAVTSHPNHFDNIPDASKDILNFLSFKESSIDIQNYADSFADNLKESNLDKLLKESSIIESNINDLSITYSDLKSFIFEESNETPNGLTVVQNNLSGIEELSPISNDNLSNIKELSLISNDNLSSIKELSNDKLTSDNKTLNTDEVERNGNSNSLTEPSGDILSYSSDNKISSFSKSKTSVNTVTYASILNSNINNSSSDPASLIVRQNSSDSASLNCNDTVNQLFKSNLNWPLPGSKVVSDTSSTSPAVPCSTSKQSLIVNSEIVPSKRYCDIKETNSDLATAYRNSCQKDNGFESSSEEPNKDSKQCGLEVSDQKASSKEFVYEFELPQELCGRLIGKHGRNVKSIMEHSNANVFIKHHPYDPLLKVVVVEGHRADVNEALEIIRRKYPPSLFPTVTLVQTNVLSSTGVPMPESLQLHLPEGASCDVILSSLVSAGHFFLQQPTHPTYPSLSTLDQCMIHLYSQMDAPILPQPIEAGVICAAPVYRGWYRAQVVHVCDNSSDCGIKFVDYGGFSQVPISSLRQIRSDLMSLPFQASECYLAQVRPLGGGETWSSEATSVFEELAQGQILQALLVEYAYDGIPCVYLYRVQGVSSTFINKELVERGLAEWVGNSSHWDPH